MSLSAARFEQAAAFIEANARPLDKALFAYHFSGGSKTAVLDALVAYQNDDGGFGHGIEPDFRLAASSPMATSVGLQYCAALEVTADHPLLQNAIRYLLQTLNEDGDFWYATYADVNSAPHAFWWHVDELTPPLEAQWPNPSAELVGYLQQYAPLVPPELLARLTARAQTNLDSSAIISGDSVQMYNILTWERALPHLPPDLAEAVTGKIRHTYATWQPDEPEKFGELNVIAFAQTPYAIMAQQYPELVDKLLAQVITRQAPDGGWWPNWHWGQYDDAWPVAQGEWAGKITAETLFTLRAFGNLADGNR